MIKPEYREEIEKRINKPQNFFKHGSSDPDAVLDFKPDAVEFILAFACHHLETLADRMPPESLVFTSWFLVQHPELIAEEYLEVHLNGSAAAGIQASDKDGALKLLNNLLDFEEVGEWPMDPSVSGDADAASDLIQKLDSLKNRRGKL